MNPLFAIVLVVCLGSDLGSTSLPPSMDADHSALDTTAAEKVSTHLKGLGSNMITSLSLKSRFIAIVDTDDQ